MARRAVAFGCEGLRLTDAERQFFAQADPWGFILFDRNIDTPDQVRALTSQLRAAVGWQAPILIDQEGGRVQRMRGPHWRDWLPALDQMTRARDPLRAQYLRYRLIAHDLHSAGLDVDCAPLADLVECETHPVLRNRLYGSEIEVVVQAARACAQGLLDGGVLPVLKHIPGYGRASVDSHIDLPRVAAPAEDLGTRDFATFAALADLPLGMTAHVVYDDIDPSAPATTSERMITLIREEIGFQGLLISDDLGMEALSGTLPDRAEACLSAGCDIALHCNGTLDERRAVAAACGLMSDEATARSDAALSQRRPPEPVDTQALLDEFRDLLG